MIWPRRLRRGHRSTLTVRARDIRIGDLVRPKDNPEAPLLPVIEIRDYGSELEHIPTLYLIVLAGRDHTTILYPQDELVIVERRS